RLTVMDAREQRGLVLAATTKITPYGERWKVPSQSGNGFYMVSHLDDKDPQCSCPDYETRRLTCKHIYAVTYVMRRELHEDGLVTMTETITETEIVEKASYPQNWSAYNQAQTNEKDKFQSLLFDLCKGVKLPDIKKAGRPRIPLSDAIFSSIYKVYSS